MAVTALLAMLPARLRRLGRRRDERGAVLILGALFAGIAVLGAALAVDIGRIVQDKRNDQRVADLVALNAVRGLQDQSGANRRALVEALAHDAAVRNGFDPAGSGNSMTVELGVIAPGTTDFVPIPPGNPAADETANAVRVQLGSVVPFFFAAGQRTLRATAIARLTGGPLGTVRVGSTLAAADFDSAALGPLYAAILNNFLNQTRAAAGLPSGNLSLSAVSWKGIATTSVTLGELAGALGVGSPSQALTTAVSYADLVRATADVLAASGDPSKAAVATSLGAIATQFDAASGMTLTLGDLVEVAGDAGNGTDIADVSLAVMDLVRGGAMVGNGTHFVEISVPASIPNVASVTVGLSLIEAPRQAVGPAGTDTNGAYVTEARTAQVALSVRAVIGLSVLGLGVTGTVEPSVEGARARAGLDSITCSVASQPDGVAINASTDAANVRLPVQLDVRSLGLPVARVTADVASSAPGAGPELLEFDPPFVDPGVPQSIAAGGLSLPTLQSADLTVTLLGLLPIGVTAGGLVAALLGPLNQVVAGLDQQVVVPVAKALGLSYAGADVWAPPVQKCDPTTFEGDPTALSLPTLVG